jgi:hypothetical protein
LNLNVLLHNLKKNKIMKKLIGLFSILISFVSNAQLIVKSDSILFRQCNAIEISSNLSNDELYDICGNTLIVNGLIIESAVKDFHSITTKPFGSSLSKNTIIYISIINQKIKIKGVSTNRETDWITTVKTIHNGFDQIQDFANQIKDKTFGKIIYLQEKYPLLEK